MTDPIRAAAIAAVTESRNAVAAEALAAAAAVTVGDSICDWRMNGEVATVIRAGVKTVVLSNRYGERVCDRAYIARGLFEDTMTIRHPGERTAWWHTA